MMTQQRKNELLKIATECIVSAFEFMSELDADTCRTLDEVASTMLSERDSVHSSDVSLLNLSVVESTYVEHCIATLVDVINRL